MKEFNEKHEAMESKYSNFIPQSRMHNIHINLPVFMFRQNKSIYEIIEMSKQPFTLATNDANIINDVQMTLDLDISNGCSESCEVF